MMYKIKIKNININMENLNYLKEYLLINYNLESKINKSNKLFYIKNIKYIYFIFILIIIIFIIILFFFKINIKTIIPIIILLFFIQKYFFMIYHYKNINKYNNNYIKYDLDNLDFETGDILQECVNWDNSQGFLTYFIDIDYLHNIFIIKFNNNYYGLHFLKSNFGFPENYLGFDCNNIEIFPLIDYLKDNDYSVKFYRLFKNKKKIKNNNVFNFLKSLPMKKLSFSFLPNFNSKELIDNSNKYHCLSFILFLLNYCNAIPKLNYQNFISDDLIFLPQLSNYIYDEPIIINFFDINK